MFIERLNKKEILDFWNKSMPLSQKIVFQTVTYNKSFKAYDVHTLLDNFDEHYERTKDTYLSDFNVEGHYLNGKKSILEDWFIFLSSKFGNEYDEAFRKHIRTELQKNEANSL